jgi:hypothetical protein
MSSLLALFAALVLGLSVPSGTAFHRGIAPNTTGGSSAGTPAATHRSVARPMDVFGGPGM